jgi:hypothetical protein
VREREGDEYKVRDEEIFEREMHRGKETDMTVN